MIELQKIETKIHEVRGQKVMLDFDLAELYGTETKRLKEAVRRNINRFPGDFMFELTRTEYNFLRSQIASLETSKGTHSKYLPFAFTEQGVAMLSSVLNSEKAIDVNIAIMRAFVLLRQHLSDYKDLKEQIAILEKEMNIKFKDIHQALNYLLKKDKVQNEQQNRDKIGFKKEQ